MSRFTLFETGAAAGSIAIAMGLASLGAPGCYIGGEPEEHDYGFTTGALMLPGQNCLRCHSEGSQYSKAPVWSAGGTVFSAADAEITEGVKGVHIELTDKRGKTVRLTSNSAGNFYSAQALEGPFHVALEYEGKRVEMPIEAPAGSCNACHSYPDPSGDAKGRIRIPSDDTMVPTATPATSR